MTIRPVDFQVIIPRVTEVAKVQHTTDQQGTLQQQQFAEQWQHISANRQQQVQGTTKGKESKVGRENHSNEQSYPKNGQKHQDSKQSHSDADIVNHASSEDPVRGNLIDIRT